MCRRVVAGVSLFSRMWRQATSSAKLLAAITSRTGPCPETPRSSFRRCHTAQPIRYANPNIGMVMSNSTTIETFLI